jgi:hypothetical protein
MARSNYEVVVGNIGTVYTGANKAVAQRCFKGYAGRSRLGVGRGAHENVTLFQNGEIVKEHTVVEPSENPNTNCLEGMRCPSCGSYGPFQMEANIVVLVSDEGTQDAGGDYEWDLDHSCKCEECSHAATIGDFTEEPQQAPTWRVERTLKALHLAANRGGMIISTVWAERYAGVDQSGRGFCIVQFQYGMKAYRFTVSADWGSVTCFGRTRKVNEGQPK